MDKAAGKNAILDSPWNIAAGCDRTKGQVIYTMHLGDDYLTIGICGASGVPLFVGLDREGVEAMTEDLRGWLGAA